ncbi:MULTISPECIES: hypothetical protein [unclassified Streptomyces]|uniref:hypothetical protein n=1 Tax=unclassified Streptomyces TaxID=2593676 RepID=UPI003394D21D
METTPPKVPQLAPEQILRAADYVKLVWQEQGSEGAGDPGPLVPARLLRRPAAGPGDPPPVRPGEVGGVGELVGGRGPEALLGHGELTGVPGQGRVGDVVVQAGREGATAQGLHEALAGFGQDVAAGEARRTVKTAAATSTAASAVSTSGPTRARITAPAARHRSSSPSTIALPKRRTTEVRHPRAVAPAA